MPANLASIFKENRSNTDGIAVSLRRELGWKHSTYFYYLNMPIVQDVLLTNDIKDTYLHASYDNLELREKVEDVLAYFLKNEINESKRINEIEEYIDGYLAELTNMHETTNIQAICKKMELNRSELRKKEKKFYQRLTEKVFNHNEEYYRYRREEFKVLIEMAINNLNSTGVPVTKKSVIEYLGTYSQKLYNKKEFSDHYYQMLKHL